VEVSTEGDSFFAAFGVPAGAVRAAVAAQRGLARRDWPAGFPVRVRMGLHTGEGVRGGDNYVGIDVNRAARIAAGDPARIAEALYNQAFIVGAGGEFDSAARLFEESHELFRRVGDESGMARAEWMSVIRDLAAGNWERPIGNAEGAVATWRRTGDRL
jgi:hypothetical protein